MSAITFKPRAGATAEAPKPEAPVLDVTVVEEKPLAMPKDAFEQHGISRSDITLPRVNLVQKTGVLCDSFQPGSFVFEKQIVLAKSGESFSATVIGHNKYFRENVVYGSDEFGRRARDEAEVRAMGGTTLYDHPAEVPYFQPVADFLLAVKAPTDAAEDVLQHFPLEFDGEHYALAVYTAAKSSYTSLAKRIFTDAFYTLKDGLHLAEYHIKAELKKNGPNSWFVPVAAMPKRHNNPDKAEFFLSLKGN